MTRLEDRQTLMDGIAEARAAGARLAPLCAWSVWMSARRSVGTLVMAKPKRTAGLMPSMSRRRTR